MKRLALAIALACVLSGSALAGEIPSTGAPAPPPASETETDPGIIHHPGIASVILTILSLVR